MLPDSSSLAQSSDDIGLALTVGCSKPKAVKEVGCCGKTNKEVPTAWAGWLQETAYL